MSVEPYDFAERQYTELEYLARQACPPKLSEDECEPCQAKWELVRRGAKT